MGSDFPPFSKFSFHSHEKYWFHLGKSLKILIPDVRGVFFFEQKGFSHFFLLHYTGRIRDFLVRWLCGVEKRGKVPPKLSKEEQRELQLKATSIEEDPYWSNILGINAVICAGVAVFLHGFWA